MSTYIQNPALKTIHCSFSDFRDIEALDLEMLPVELVCRGSRLLGGLAVFFGAAFSLIPVAALIMAAAKKEMPWTTALFSSIALFIFFGPVALYGINQFIRRKTVTLDLTTVAWEIRSLFKKRRETEIIKNYAGVVFEVRYDATQGRFNVLELHHSEPAKCLLLSTSRNDEKILERWRYYCRHFDLPALEYFNPEDLFSRDLDDLSKSMVELIKEKKVELPRLSSPPPQNIAVEDKEGRQWISLSDGTSFEFDESGFHLHQKQFFGRDVFYSYKNIESIKIERVIRSAKMALFMVHRIIARDPKKEETMLHFRTSFAVGLNRSSMIWLQNYLLRKCAGI
jgi:hypothetical protein